MLKQTKGVDERFDKLEKLVNGMGDKLLDKFDGLETRFDGLEQGLDGLEGRFDGLETTQNEMREELEHVLNFLGEKVPTHEDLDRIIGERIARSEHNMKAHVEREADKLNKQIAQVGNSVDVLTKALIKKNVIKFGDIKKIKAVNISV